MSDFLVIADLNARIGAATVRRLIDDSGNAVIDGDETGFLDTLFQEAEGLVFSWMGRAGYDAAGVVLLATGDEAFRGQAAWLAIELLSERRIEFASEEGWGAYRTQYERAEKYFDQLSKGRRRSKGEATAGTSGNVGGNISPSPPAGTEQQFVFAPSSKAPGGHGGFALPIIFALSEMLRAGVI